MTASFPSARSRLLIAAAVLALCSSIFAATQPHRYDHVVVVIEENRSVTQIIGDRVNAPYINSLADDGVTLGNMFAITHPSQPNYIHLFAGVNGGIWDDNLPTNFSITATATYPFRFPNLGAELLANGFTFATFSEQIEAAGTNDWADYDPHSATDPSVYYRRKHNPVANWIAKVTPVPTNQLPKSANLAFTNFPSDFRKLPTVSFVVPNQMNDMHDGSRKQGDAWLQTNLNAYAQWATSNNSLLIITWDEDDYNGMNQIPTILYGAGLRNGTAASSTWTLHDLLRTLEDMYGCTNHAGAAAQCRRIVGPFADDPSVTNATFRQGVNGFTGVQDTYISVESPTTTNASTSDLVADLDTNSGVAGNQEAQALIRFNGFFGSGAGQVPTNAIIHAAKLIIITPTNSGAVSMDTFFLHRMISEWNDTATWNSLGNGVSTDNVEATNASTFSVVPSVDGTAGAPAIFDVTSDIELFRGGITNRGWLIRAATNGTGNGWTMKSSEATASMRPSLEITYSMPSPYLTWAASKGLSALNNNPSFDAEGDGVPNVQEFAFNLNPLAADRRAIVPGTGTNGLPIGRYLTNVSNGVLEMQFVRRKGATATNLTYTPQFSGNVTGAWVSGQAPTVTSLNSDWERVVVRDSVTGANARRFGKVGVTLQQW